MEDSIIERIKSLQEWFHDYEDNFVVIGGAACSLIMAEHRGESIDRSDINKHRRDIYRLADLISDGFKFTLPESVERDMCTFITNIQELLINTPQKERRSERARIERIIEFFGLPPSLLQ